MWETFRPDIIAWVAFPGDIIARRAFRGPVTLPRGDISHPALVPWSQDWVWSAQTSGLLYTAEHGLCPLWVHFWDLTRTWSPRHATGPSQNRWKRNTTTKLFLSAVFTRKNALEQKNELGFHWSNLTKVSGGLIVFCFFFFFFSQIHLVDYETDLLLQTMISMFCSKCSHPILPPPLPRTAQQIPPDRYSSANLLTT